MRWNFDPAGPLPRRAGVRTEGRSAGGRGMTSVAPLRGDRASRGGPNLPVSDPSTVTRRRGSIGRQPLAALPLKKIKHRKTGKHKKTKVASKTK